MRLVGNVSLVGVSALTLLVRCQEQHPACRKYGHNISSENHGLLANPGSLENVHYTEACLCVVTGHDVDTDSYPQLCHQLSELVSSSKQMSSSLSQCLTVFVQQEQVFFRYVLAAELNWCLINSTRLEVMKFSEFLGMHLSVC